MSKSYADLVKGAIVDFNVVAPDILGEGFTSCTVNGRFDADTANLLGLDVQAKHQNLYPLVKPQGIPDNPDSYDFIKVTKTSGAQAILWLPWIVESTIAPVSRNKINVVIEDVGSKDIAVVKAALESNGYLNAVVTLIDN
ncbi:hypothetical protein RAY_219 [Erwinia phage vB_EamM_RAY]|uniref:SH3 fold domain-containing protein n=10 Tax=Agricanvirus TaxID=1984776 RepID=A0A173GF00_9CAUD|nr:hypothetical protein Ea357_216 [Erwinia phage Ea35-70]YP_009605367.1 hypothetical protein FDH97_gp224 [Erwinia phage vB_EamM_Deimos-Minion]YP_009605685.1 hypothetical protein FDH98_gp299 [Erwinia phage vB_EamM_RAY]YP_009606007.1 hypothetical protein FDH99_gp302 [Erwinia phage vB_EamM_Simmy50]YP_009606327.1 hypothetical protein FDI00_gp221 [Erwinia phage vB_EamM_Special G]YP_009621960.1 hypothetical protein FDJ23_gp219 [Erwinia phage vB_EamM_Desertfox]AUG86007.1 hypothetical protein BOSOLAP